MATTNQKHPDLAMELISSMGDEAMLDIILEANDGGKVPASRFVLGARSTVLRQLLFGESVHSGRVRLDFSTKTIRALVHYCLTDELDPIWNAQGEVAARELVELCDIAITFQLIGLEDLAFGMISRITKAHPHMACAIYDEMRTRGKVLHVYMSMTRVKSTTEGEDVAFVVSEPEKAVFVASDTQAHNVMPTDAVSLRRKSEHSLADDENSILDDETVSSGASNYFTSIHRNKPKQKSRNTWPKDAVSLRRRSENSIADDENSILDAEAITSGASNYVTSIHRNKPKQKSQNTWLADRVASSHMRNSLDGMYDLQDAPPNDNIRFSNNEMLRQTKTFNETLRATKIGTWKGFAKQKDGTTKNVILHNVKYVPGLARHLFSLTVASSKGCELLTKGRTLIVTKGALSLKFDRRIPTKQGFLSGILMEPDMSMSETCNQASNQDVEISAEELRQRLSHAFDEKMHSTLKPPEWTITDNKKKNISKPNDDKKKPAIVTPPRESNMYQSTNDTAPTLHCPTIRRVTSLREATSHCPTVDEAKGFQEVVSRILADEVMDSLCASREVDDDSTERE